MLQYQQLELLTYERQKMFLEEAEQRRLEEMLLAQSRPKHKPIHHLLRWIGAQHQDVLALDDVQCPHLRV